MQNFKDIYEQKQAILRKRPDKCQVEVSAQSHLVEAFRSQVTTRGFEIIVDQPGNMGSTDQGPRPSEYVLAALAACHEVTYRLYADAMEIDLKDISVSVTGKSDARGFFNVDEAVSAGFSEVVGTIDIVSDASDEDLESVASGRSIVIARVLDDLTKPMKVETRIKNGKRGRKPAPTDSSQSG